MRPSQGPGVDRIRATTSATISAGVSVPKVSPGQYEIVSGLFGHLAPRLRIVSCDAASHLKATPGAYDVLYSVFVALDFTDPRELLPVAVTALRPGGQLAFSTLAHYGGGAPAQPDVVAASVPARTPEGKQPR